MNILRNLFTGQDGVTHDLGRWSWAASWAAVVAAAGANWWHGAAIDLTAFGTALCAVAGAHGAALWAKRDTEPKA
jgi:hypothetical protein